MCAEKRGIGEYKAYVIQSNLTVAVSSTLACLYPHAQRRHMRYTYAERGLFIACVCASSSSASLEHVYAWLAAAYPIRPSYGFSAAPARDVCGRLLCFRIMRSPAPERHCLQHMNAPHAHTSHSQPLRCDLPQLPRHFFPSLARSFSTASRSFLPLLCCCLSSFSLLLFFALLIYLPLLFFGLSSNHLLLLLVLFAVLLLLDLFPCHGFSFCGLDTAATA